MNQLGNRRIIIGNVPARNVSHDKNITNGAFQSKVS